MSDPTTPAEQPEVAYHSTQDAAQALLARWQGKAEKPTAEADESEVPDAEEQADDDAEQGDEPTAEAADESEAQVEDEIELDVGGDKLRLPGKLREQAEHIQRKVKELEAGSTRKFQEAAELRKHVEQEREQVAFIGKLAAQHTDLLADLRSTQREISQLEQVDWNALSDSDPVTAQKAMARLMTQQHTQARIVAQLQEASKEIASQEAAVRNANAQRGTERLSKLIPNFSDATRKDLAQYVATRDLTPEGRNALWDPEVVAAFHDAKKYRELTASKPAIDKRAALAQKTLTPGKAGAPATSAKAQIDAAKRRLRESGKTDDVVNLFLARAKAQR